MYNLFSVLFCVIIAIAGEHTNPLPETKGVIQMSSSQCKHYRDRDRYLRMTPDQREAYLQRNREYKRMRRDRAAACINVEPTSQQMKSGTSKTKYMTGNFSKSIDGTDLILIWQQNVRLSS
jgi:hypothetical protein